MRTIATLIAAASLALAGCDNNGSPSAEQGSTPTSGANAGESDETTPYVLDFEMERLDGSVESLEKYKGNVVMIVNTASHCGLTPQYKALQTLHSSYEPYGLIVLGFPANNFMNQEPGTDEEIAAFCEENYGVTFPMFSKISVKGEDQHPLYKRLTSQPEPIGGEVAWNFQKYLVDQEGNVIARFGPRTKPDDPEIVAKVQEMLGLTTELGAG